MKSRFSMGCCCGGSGTTRPPWTCAGDATATLTMTWYYEIGNDRTAAGGPLVATLNWNGTTYWESGVLTLPPDSEYGKCDNPVFDACCGYYRIRVYCNPPTTAPSVPPGAFIFINSDPGFGPATDCLLPAQEGPIAGTVVASPYAVMYDNRPVVPGVAQFLYGMLTP